MSRKLLNKLLSAILVFAICSATVFGCMLNVSAYYSGTYTFSGGIAPYAAKQASIDLTFELAAGFAAGDFAVTNADGNFTTASVKVKGGTTADGSAFDASNIVAEFNADEEGTYLGYVTFWTNELKYYTSLTLELTYTMTDWVKAGGAKYAVDIAEVVLAAESDVDVTVTGSEGYIHNHHAWLNNENLDPTTAGDGNHLVYDTTCRICTSQYPIKQVMANYTQISGGTAVDKYPNGNLGISAVNVVYNDDGTVNLMIHGYSPYYRSGNYIVVTDTEGKIYDKYELTSNTTSQYAGNVLVDNAQVWTIENFSARDIHTELLFTMMYNDNGTIRTSTTVAFSLADYCLDVVNGNAVWEDDATTEQIDADKDVAAALYYYGATIDESVFEKTSASSGADNGVEYTDVKVDVWDGTTTQPTETDADGNIVIRTAEQLAWIALAGGTETNGNNYVVADNMAFDMNGMTGIKVDSTAANVKAATQNTDVAWTNSSNAFGGNFDGNGLIVYNLYTNAAYAGLFPVVKPVNNGDTLTIKNVSVKASFIAGYHYAGGIVGLANAPGTSSIVSFDGCAVANCYIGDNGDTNSACNRTASAIAGSVNHNKAVVNNCIAINNNIAATNIQGGFVGNSSAYAGTGAVSNSIIIGSTMAPVDLLDDTKSIHPATANTTYTNVYDSSTALKGIDAVSGMGLDSSVWLANTSYPELAIFHNIAAKYIDETTHRLVCNLQIDGVKCTLVGADEKHTMVENAEGTLNECICGYSQKIISKIDYIDANYDEWDGTKTAPTETDADGNYIINTAEELAWIALEGGTSTNDVSYKVKANSVFNMNGMSGITMSSTAAQVKAATKNTSYNWTRTNNFGGSFDGNGLIVYNLYSDDGYAGLFPHVKPSTNDASCVLTFKNVKVMASYIEGYHYAAGIVGYGDAPGKATGLTFDSCEVVNCYISDNGSTNTACNRTAAGIVGSIMHNKTTIDNCAVINNDIVGTNVTAGFVGGSSDYAKAPAVTNSFVVGTAKAAASTNGTTIKTAIANTTFTNVYDSSSALTGANAVSGMGLSSSTWFATDSYPELSVFHSLAMNYINEETHAPICRIKINGQLCSVCGVAEEHTMVENADGTANVCECGLSEEIVNLITYTTANYDEWDGTQVEPTETDSNGNIVINTAEELAWVALSTGGTNTADYIVKANSVFNMNGKTGITLDSTAAEVKAATPTGNYWVSNSSTFTGNFDGNGVIIYNISTQGGSDVAYAGLFPNVNNQSATPVYSNITVKASCFIGYHTAAGIVSYANGTNNVGTLTFNNCWVENCYMSDNGSTNTACQRTSGALAGLIGHNGATVNNCMALNNTFVSTNITGGFIGNTSAYGLAVKINNSISIGTSPVSTQMEGSSKTLNAKASTGITLTNVYDSSTALTGANAVSGMGLDGNTWFATESYPELSVFHILEMAYADDSTHIPTCGLKINGVACDVCGIAEEHTLVENTDGTANECECGYSEKIISKIDYIDANYDEWDGTKTAPTETDADGNYIINTAEELAWIALEGGTSTNGVNYKVAANSVFNMNGMTGITMSSTAAEVKAATKNTAYNWADGSNFAGNFDGNGLIVYNIYSNGAYAGLFTHIYPSTNDASCVLTFKNVKVMASYIVGYHYAGGIVGNGDGPGTAPGLTFDSCEVVNCYISDNGNTNSACNRSAAGIAGTIGHNKTTINNCAVINNDIVGTSITAGFIAKSSIYASTPTVSNSIVIGTEKAAASTNGTTIPTAVINTTFTNVYDSSSTVTGANAVTTMGLDGDTWFATESYPELAIFHVLATQYVDATTHKTVCAIKINGVQCNLCGLSTAHEMVDSADGTMSECHCGYSYENQGINSLNLPAEIVARIVANSTYAQNFMTDNKFKAAYAADVNPTDFTSNCYMYATSLNLKTNPHIAFTFAFLNEYKTDKANVTFTFKVDDSTIATVTGADMINNAGAGRYHLYRLKALPVTQLCEQITVSASYGGTTTDMGAYSAAGYAINAMNAGADYNNHKIAAMSLVYYSEMLAARYGA